MSPLLRRIRFPIPRRRWRHIAVGAILLVSAGVLQGTRFARVPQERTDELQGVAAGFVTFVLIAWLLDERALRRARRPDA